MATNESSASSTTTEQAAPETKHEFEPVNYGMEEVQHAQLPGGAVQDFANTVEAVSMGSASILRLIEWDVLRGDAHEADPDSQPAPVLNEFHRGVLLRMVAANMDLITDEANRLKDWAYQRHTIKGRAEQLAAAMQLVDRCERLASGERA